jgi:hypothetical protein
MRDHLLELDMLSIIRGRKSASGSVGGEAYTLELRVEPPTVIGEPETVSQFDPASFDDFKRTSISGQ